MSEVTTHDHDTRPLTQQVVSTYSHNRLVDDFETLVRAAHEPGLRMVERDVRMKNLNLLRQEILRRCGVQCS